MTGHPDPRRSILTRFLRSSHFPTAILISLLFALTVWITPPRIEQPRRSEWPTHHHLQALAEVWWQALLLSVFLAALMALMLFRRRWLFEKASAVRFLAASLFIH